MTARLTAVLLLTLSPALARPAAERISHPKHAAKATNILWRNPGRVESLGFANGVGGSAKAPHPPFRFVEEDMTGSNPKLKVRDARGAEWSVKWSDEAKPEVFASRLAWACGYIAQPEYFVAAGRITGVKHLTRAASSVKPDGSFRDARFQLRTKWPKFLKQDNWAWNYNPFVGTKELNGLKVLIMLTSNWDNKDARDIDRDSNLAIFEASKHPQRVYLYFVADWGATMGKWGHVYGRTEWDCKGYTEQTPSLVKGVHKGVVEWGYSGQHTEDAVKGIQVSDVAWLMRYLGRITDAQLRAGLRASGATPDETECFTRAVRTRIDELRRVARSSD
jgi:hypothetical protein